MTTEEIRLRRLQGQHLLQKTDALTVVRDLCGLQAQFLSCALHALQIRSHQVDVTGMVKGWTNRGTMHLFAEEDLPLFLHQGRKRFLRPVDTLDADDCMTAQRKAYFSEVLIEAIARGVDEREALKTICEDAGMTEAERECAFDPWGGMIRALCEAGRICHKPQEKKAYRLCPPFAPMDGEAACLELARRYFKHYGPATVKDAAYFFGVPQASVKGWLRELPATEITVEGKTYFQIGEGMPLEACPDCLFLAGFDQLMLGYEKKESLFFAQAHLREIFTLAGGVRPTVLIRGNVGGWWNLKNNVLTIRLFDPSDRMLVNTAADRQWNGLRKIIFV